MTPGDLDRVADGRQVDRRIPREQQPDVVVDRRSGVWREGDLELPETGVDCVAELRGKKWKVLNARRERITRTVQALLLSVVPVRAVRAPLPASFLRTSGRASVFRGRSGSRPGLPVPLASPVTRVTLRCGCRTLVVGRAGVNGVIHESTSAARGCG
jgi:hypothetical protein